MEEQFVTYDVALKLKELGFKEKCLASFHFISKDIVIMGNKEFSFNKAFELSAPLWQQVIDWFREEYNIQIVNMLPIPPEAILASQGRLDHKKGHCFILYSTDWNPRLRGFDFYNEDYYKAREAAILKAIELCQKEK